MAIMRGINPKPSSWEEMDNNRTLMMFNTIKLGCAFTTVCDHPEGGEWHITDLQDFNLDHCSDPDIGGMEGWLVTGGKRYHCSIRNMEIFIQELP